MTDKKEPISIVIESRFAKALYTTTTTETVLRADKEQRLSITTERLNLAYSLSNHTIFPIPGEEYYCRLVSGAGLNFAAFVFADFVRAKTSFRNSQAPLVGLLKPIGGNTNHWVPVSSSGLPSLGFIGIEPAYSGVDLSSAASDFCLVFEFAPASWVKGGYGGATGSS